MGLADVPFTIQTRNRPCHFQHPLASAGGQAELLGDKGWKGMGDWLGTATSSTRGRKYCDFKSARTFVHSLGLENRTRQKTFESRRAGFLVRGRRMPGH